LIDSAKADTTREVFNVGVYYNYSLNSGEIPNTLGTGSSEVAEPTLRTDARRDARYLLKVDSVGPRTQLNITSRLRFAHYKARPFFGKTGQDSPVPWV